MNLTPGRVRLFFNLVSTRKSVQAWIVVDAEFDHTLAAEISLKWRMRNLRMVTPTPANIY
jgi:hypothetical protein